MRDIAIPVRPKARTESLRYALRSIHRHVPHGRVYVVGGRPDYLSDQITHLPTTQDSDPFTNVGRALTALLDSDISEDFYWWQDDLFALEAVTEPIPLRARLQPLDTYVDLITRNLATGATYHRQYVAGVKAQRDMLRAWGYDTAALPNGCCHYPTPVNKTHLKHTLERIAAHDPGHPLGHFKAVHSADLPVEQIRDCKVMGTRVPLPAWQFVSTSAASWKGATGKKLMARLVEPSPYERTKP